RPSRPRPLTLRLLTGLAHAHQKSASFSSRRLLSFYYMFSA
ncbi:hypothetical protein HMPREF0541_00936, partial [Lacticaseibacillus rhamnosus ATCC 21052]